MRRCPFPEFPEPKIPKAKKLRHYQPPTFQPDAEFPLRFKPIMSIHHDALLQLFRNAEEDDEQTGWKRAYEFYQAIHLEEGQQGNHRLMGDVYELATDIRGQCHDLAKSRARAQAKGKSAERRPYRPPTEREKKPWRLLALLDSNIKKLGWCWGDVGQLCFCIREEDLAKRNFSKALAILDSS